MPPKKIDRLDHPRDPFEARKNDALGVTDNEFEDSSSDESAAEVCPVCGAFGGAHELGCPHEDGSTAQNESTEFDKFMQSTLLKEQRERKIDETVVSPQRKIIRGYQERPLGRTRFGGRR